MPTKEEIESVVIRACGALSSFLESINQPYKVLVLVAPSADSNDVSFGTTADRMTSYRMARKFLDCGRDSSRLLDERALPPKAEPPALPQQVVVEVQSDETAIGTPREVVMIDEPFDGCDASEIAAQAAERLVVLFEHNGMAIDCFIALNSDYDVTAASTGPSQATNRMISKFLRTTSEGIF
jgi:hypothetical protein